MSTASRIIQLLNDRVSQEPLSRISMSDGHEIEIASQLFDALKSILTSSPYDHEYATTLDYSTPDTEIDGCEEDPDEPITYQDYEEEDSETPVYESFSFGYMKRAIEFYDDIDQKIDKRETQLEERKAPVQTNSLPVLFGSFSYIYRRDWNQGAEN